MADPKSILARQIRQKIRRLDAEKEKLVDALDVIENLDLSDDEAVDAEAVSDVAASSNGTVGAEDSLDNDELPLRDAAKIVIEREGKPLTVPQIAERLLESPYPYDEDEKTLRRSLSGVLGRWARKEAHVYRPEKGHYAPIEWADEE